MPKDCICFVVRVTNWRARDNVAAAMCSVDGVRSLIPYVDYDVKFS